MKIKLGYHHFKFFWEFFSGNYRYKFIILLLAMIVSALFEILTLSSLMFIADVLTKEPKAVSFEFTWLNLAISFEEIFFFLFSLLTIKILFQIWQARFQANISYEIMSLLSTKLFNHYTERHTLLDPTKNRPTLLRNTIREPTFFSGSVLMPIFNLFTELVLVLGILTFLLYSNILATVILFSFIIATTSIWLKFTRPRLNKLGAKTQAEESVRIKLFEQSLNVTKDILLSNFIEITRCKFLSSTNSVAKYSALHSFYKNINRGVLEYIGLLSILFLTWILYLIHVKMDLILEAVVLMLISLLRLLPSINKISISINFLSFNSATVDVLYKEFKKYTKINKTSLNTILNPRDDWTAINIENLSFVYPGMSQPGLYNKSFSLFRNKLNIIMGKSGSGKSTFVDLLIGLYTPTHGQFYIMNNNKKIGKGIPYRLQDISYVSQKNLFLDDTLLNNIILGDESKSMSKVLVSQLIEMTCLNEVVSNLPAGLDTVIGDAGTVLSGGELQRVAIARALYRKPSLLILDEATSALDKPTAQKILHSIQQLQNLTIVMITHDQEHLMSTENAIHFY